MSVVQVPDDLQRVIERQVAEGRAASPAAFLEEVVLRLVDEATTEEHELQQVIEAGSAGIGAGRYTTVQTAEDERRLLDGMMARLKARLPGR